MPGIRSLSFVLTIGLVLATAGAALAQGVLHRSHDGDPGSLDPLRTTSVAEAHLLRDLYEGLVIHTMKGEIAPGVAENWTTSEDGLVWRFMLRRDARWSNGEPVTASDFVFSMRRMVDPRSGRALWPPCSIRS